MSPIKFNPTIFNFLPKNRVLTLLTSPPAFLPMLIHVTHYQSLLFVSQFFCASSMFVLYNLSLLLFIFPFFVCCPCLSLLFHEQRACSFMIVIVRYLNLVHYIPTSILQLINTTTCFSEILNIFYLKTVTSAAKTNYKRFIQNKCSGGNCGQGWKIIIAKTQHPFLREIIFNKDVKIHNYANHFV